MSSVLANIQDDICKYADAIGGITGTDVEIVDEFMIRVAGTGVYRHMLNEDMTDQGYIYRHTMQSRATTLIENPGESPICSHCRKRFTCRETLDLSTPILLDNRVIGVIGIICSTHAHREALLGQIDTFISFIEQIAELIAGKVYEYLERQREREISAVFRRFIDAMDRGVIALDDDGAIWHANLSAMRMLNRAQEIIGETIAIEPTGDIVYDSEEAYLRLGDTRLHALCRRIEVPSLEGRKLAVLVFEDARDFLTHSGALSNEPLSPVKLIGRSPRMQALRAGIDRIAISSASVLITGESGSGKEVVASAIHRSSLRREQPFVTINCAAIPEQLLESELFGYVKGAFSGADPKGRIGKFELADGGTIFLDEIGDMPVFLQAKLLRVLQERTVTRIGSNQIIGIDVRVIAATNKDIGELVHRRLFREDLLYRLNVVPLSLPPLRARREDIAELAQSFANEFADLYGRPKSRLPDEIINRLYFFDWPGNVRELRNTVEYMYVMQGDAGPFNESHLPPALMASNDGGVAAAPPLPTGAKATNLPGETSSEERAIVKALSRHGASLDGKKAAARDLGLSIATFYRRLKKYGIAR